VLFRFVAIAVIHGCWAGGFAAAGITIQRQVVNLAGGLSRYKPAVEHSLDDWRAEVDNNLLSAFLTSRAAFPHLQAAGNGAIINFARAGQAQANMVAYNCAKAEFRRSPVRSRSREEISAFA